MWSYLVQGIVLGLSAGIAPGPLFALLLAETLRHGTKSGIVVALAPLITDVPIVIASIFLLSRLAHVDAILGLVSLLGCAVLLQMGWHSLRVEAVDPSLPSAPAHSLRKAILVNFLSPHPYLFWLTVGATITLKASEHGITAPAAFIGSFYGCLVGAKLVLAALVGRSRTILQGRAYRYAMRALGVMLMAFALLLLRDGLRFLFPPGLHG